MTEFRVLASGLRFPEGPIYMADGSVLVVEIERGTLTRVGAEGYVEVVAYLGGGPNGGAIGPDGKVYICNNGGFEWHEVNGQTLPGLAPANYSGGSIQRVDLDTGLVETLYTHCGDQPLRGPNDLVFDDRGGFWFTDPGKRFARSEDVGAVYYAKSDGSFISEQVFPRTHPNGIALSPDGGVLYVAETLPGRVWRFPVVGPGLVETPSSLFDPVMLLYGAPGLDFYDSMAVDSAGNVCVGTIGRGGISVITPDGLTVEHVPLPDWATTNIAFGGNDMKTAYVTLSATGRLIAMDWQRPGLRLNFNA